MSKQLLYGLILLLVLIESCKDRYFPEYKTTDKGYLVVEGILNAGNEPTNIYISRTYPIESAGKKPLEQSAIVTVEGNDNTIQTLAMTAQGIYHHAGLSLMQNIEYRLRIKTSDGQEYLSDFVKVKKTPPIDSIGFNATDKGINIYVNTHDPANNTTYYRWDFDETWEINSFYTSVIIYDKNVNPPPFIRDRIFPDEQINRCWRYGISNNLLFASSAKLTADVIHEKPIQLIPNADEKLSVLYSMLLRQYSMDKKAYEFFDLMKKNTESIGTVFDPLPSEIRGNIKCITNPDEIVIGYVSATTVERKRVFIRRPANWGHSNQCLLPQVVPPDSVDYYFGTNALIPVSIQPRENSSIVDYLGGEPACVDCRSRGGNIQRPSFWPN